MTTQARLAVIVLAVSDLDRAAAFYAASFGWPRIVTTPVYVEFRMSEQQRLGLYIRHAFRRNIENREIIAPKDGEVMGSELYFYADDVEVYCQRLAQAGAHMLSPLQARNWSDEAAYYADPDGNVLVVARPLAS